MASNRTSLVSAALSREFTPEAWRLVPCVLWTKSFTRQGYGQQARGLRRLGTRTTVLAHRDAWERERGPIPKGLVVCHHCDNPPCVNVEHLFLGTNADNTRDMIAKGRHASLKKSHCKWGHAFDEANTYVTAKGHRICRQCAADRISRRRAQVALPEETPQ